MNFSLLIIVIMLAIVIPALARHFFPQEKPRQTFLEPVVTQEKKESSTLPEIPQVMAQREVLDSHLLLDISHENTSMPRQKMLISDSLKIFATTGRYFRGYELLQALHDVGLIYGEKNLFHYIEQNEILFSVAPTSYPQVFFLDEIGSLSTEGLEFILKNEKASVLMQETAQKLLEALGERG